MRKELMRQVLRENYLRNGGELRFKEWIDLEIKNNPEGFDPFFDSSWDELEGEGQEIRAEIIFYTLADEKLKHLIEDVLDWDYLHLITDDGANGREFYLALKRLEDYYERLKEEL